MGRGRPDSIFTLYSDFTAIFPRMKHVFSRFHDDPAAINFSNSILDFLPSPSFFPSLPLQRIPPSVLLLPLLRELISLSIKLSFINLWGQKSQSDSRRALFSFPSLSSSLSPLLFSSCLISCRIGRSVAGTTNLLRPPSGDEGRGEERGGEKGEEKKEKRGVEERRRRREGIQGGQIYRIPLLVPIKLCTNCQQTLNGREEERAGVSSPPWCFKL